MTIAKAGEKLFKSPCEINSSSYVQVTYQGATEDYQNTSPLVSSFPEAHGLSQSGKLFGIFFEESLFDPEQLNSFSL
jgi:hypothetical protein